MTRAGIPVCGHIGSRPQMAAMTGGYVSSGRTAKEAAGIIEDAMALQEAGCRMLLIEAVPAEVTEAVLAAVTIPVIGIGAGPACHGQVIVLHDIAGLTEHPPRFAEPLADLGRSYQAVAASWVKRVGERAIGGRGYQMKPGESERLRGGTTDDGKSGPPRLGLVLDNAADVAKARRFSGGAL
jgi:3-methyl-2-oxobutanoate hydroxymethyltransferase